MQSLQKPLSIKNLIELGLHRLIISVLEDLNITELRDIQSIAINNGVLENRSMLVCSPSGSGKTLIGELAAIHNCFTKHKKSIFLVPLKAIASEKLQYFTHTYSKLNLRMVMAAGDEDVRLSVLMQADILIMTYEKFDSYLRTKSENTWIKDISTIIIDEIHILGEGQRGARLESLIIRMYEYLQEAQKIFLSATIANPNELYSWFKKLEISTGKQDLALIQSDTRPIELKYSIVETQQKTRKAMSIISSIIKDNGQVLLFTNTRKSTETISDEILEYDPYIFIEKKIELQRDLYMESLIAKAKLNKDLMLKLQRGIGFHHAGLSSDERSLVEYMFLKGYIKVIVCTNTLSAGINTPARAVIIYDYNLYELVRDPDSKTQPPRFNKIPIDRNTFHQIAGRAGRPGYDDKGTAYILSGSKEESYWIGEHYFNSVIGKVSPKYDDVRSAYIYNNALFYELMLLRIYEGQSVEYEELLEFARKSYFWHLIGSNTLSIESYLNLDMVPFMVILKLYSSPETILDVHNSQIQWEITSLAIDAFIATVRDEEEGDVYKIKVVSGKGFSCTCGCELNFLMENDFRKQEFCTHIAGLVNGLNNEYDSEFPRSFHAFDAYFQEIAVQLKNEPENPGNKITQFKTAEEIFDNSQKETLHVFNIYHHINKILHRAIFMTPLLDYLSKNEFITIETRESLIVGNTPLIINCTDFGAVTIKCYISPSTGQYLHDNLKTNPPKTIEEIFPLLTELLEKEDRKTHEDLSDILSLWIDEKTIPQIQTQLLKIKGKLAYTSDIQSFVDDSARIIRYLKELAVIRDMTDLAEIADNLYFRIKIGVKQELVPLGKVLKNFEPNIIRTVYNAGFRVPEDLIKIMRRELYDKTKLDIETCNSILEAIDYYAQSEGLINIPKARLGRNK